MSLVVERRTFHVARGKNPNYFVRIESTSGLSLIADMSEAVNFTISNSWEPRFGAGLNEYTGDTGPRLAGENVMIQEFSRLMWMNTTPIEIPLTIMFDQQTDAYKDVYLPMNALELLALPDNRGIFLTAPGPSFANPNANKTSLHLGRSWYFPSVVIMSVSSQYDTRLDARGFPISGQTEVTFSTDMVYGKADWLATQKRLGDQ